ncbi:AsmA-like C-terminal region-containing protein [Roseibacterium sp. SDUM158017]|uniref:AsmA-like C-terminal region-containing protein n=1 Tax=Roseicyclus salinarum TaxID=3036773 RepID=UPI00241546CD|nr:AsmA-like C-terminal region-containing protein [Roseibacterium sp. SDUM158017]MDG4649178.1 AsmA-like C-terminal region-containing protein [Roseibacterium sp. SDUM158017]
MNDAPKKTDGTTPGQPARAQRRGPWWWAGVGLGGVALTMLAVVAAAWVRLSLGPVDFPQRIEDRIEAHLDAGMTAGRLTIGDMVLDVPEGGRAPVIEFRDVQLSDPGGAPRAVFPALRVQLEPGPILSGQARPRRVEIAGAGLRLSRDAQGRLDLDLTGGAADARVTLPETMARLDAMFASPVFDALQEVTASGLRLSMADEMTGQIMRIDEATARLTRSGGRLALTVGGALSGSRDTTLDIAVLRDGEGDATEIAAVFRDLAARDLATASPALAWLDLMRAPISGRLALRLSDDGTVGDMEARLDIGPGRVRLAEGDAPLGFDRLAADMVYDPATRRIDFGGLRLDAPAMRLSAKGHADVAQDGNSFVGQFGISGIEAQPGDLYEAPLSIDGARVDMRLTLAPDPTIEIGEAVIFDGDLRLRGSGVAEAGADGLSLSFDAALEEAEIGEILGYWPEAVIPRTRRWVANRIEAGRAVGLNFSVRAQPGQETRRHLQTGFAGVVMRPLRDGPAVRGAAGYLDLHDARMVVRMDRATIAAEAEGGGEVALAGTTMVVDDTRPPGPEAAFHIEGEGALADLLRVLDAEPIRIFRNGAMTPERAGEGRIAFAADFRSRLMPRDRPATLEELGLTASAEVTGFASDRLVPDMRLGAEALQVSLVPDLLTVSGRALVEGVPLTGRWQRPLGPDAPRASSVEASGVVGRDSLARLGVQLPEDLLSGRGAVSVSVALPDGAPPRLELSSNLDGIALSIPALGWRLEPDETGRLQAALRLGSDPEVTSLSLAVPGFDLRGRVSLLPGGGLSRLTAERLVVGDWLDVGGALVGRGPDVPPAVEITGGRLTLGRMPPQNAPGEGGGPLNVRLDRLEISSGIALTDLTGSFVTGGGLQGEFEAAVNGAAPVTGVVAPGRFGPAVRVTAPDGGAVLRAAGIFRRAHGGAMTLTLQSAEAARSFDGALRIEGPRLRDAPAMAELLNLISVVGLLEQLSGEGINLGTVDARFRLTPERLTLAEGTAVGPSLGLSMDGVYDIADRRYEMQGVVSPLYMVNGLVGALFAPRGEGLFGFSYRLTGTAERSNVSVNPLSILTPGVFRDIFRRPPPDPSGTPAN